MSSPTATETGTVDPTANLDQWLEKREAEPESEKAAAVQASSPEPTSPAEPETVAQPVSTQPVMDWREVVLPDDVGHEFLKGKKLPEVIKSWEHAQAEVKRKQGEAAEAFRQLEAERRQSAAYVAARQVATEQQTQSQPAADPYAEIESMWFDNPRGAAAQLRELAVKEAREAAAQETQRYRQDTEREQAVRDLRETGERAWRGAQQQLGLDENTWNQRSRAILVELTDPTSPFYGDGENIKRQDAYVSTYKAIFGDTRSTPTVVIPASEPPTPPGSKKPASTVSAPPVESPMAKEDRDIRRMLAAQIPGLDADRFIKRGEKRG